MFGQFAMRVFGSVTEPYADYFDSLRASLRKANMIMPVEEYVATLMFFSLVSFIVTMIFSTLVVTIAIPSALYSYTTSIIVSIVVSGVVFLFGYYYPGMQARGIRGKIDKGLPFATFYMATTASSGVNPVEIFKLLAYRGGTLGKEAQRIYSNVKAMGMNLTAALQKAATKSPSSQWAELLWGLISVIGSGGDIEEYLNSKTRTYMQAYRRNLDDYSKQIALYTEIYITLIIVGSLFFIILIAILTPLTGGSTLFIQTFLVFFFIPIISIGFLVLLKTINPTE